MLDQFDLPLTVAVQSAAKPRKRARSFAEALQNFARHGTATRVSATFSSDGRQKVATFTNEFWTAAQRAADNLHEVSYRACFKPQLPRFFIEQLTTPGDVVYDPFMGRGTTLLEASLMGRAPFGNDINPLSAMLVRPRLNPPTVEEIAQRLDEISLSGTYPSWEELLVFYHEETLREITALKQYLLNRSQEAKFDAVDDWIRMVTLNRLTGHSPGFFSVYTLPPNQAVSIKAQRKINADRKQTPPRRDVRKILLKKSDSLLADIAPKVREQLHRLSERAVLENAPAARTQRIPDESVSLVVTSPPFLDVVDYAADNWLRCWFAGIDPASVSLTVPKKLETWRLEMTKVFRELARVLKPGGHVAFEVGEVRRGKVKLEETVLTCGTDGGLEPVLVLINQQEFTKTANCWGVDNNAKGTNSNRVVLFCKR